MSENGIAIALLPLLFILVVVVECSRLHCARAVQRRIGDLLPLYAQSSAAQDTTA